MDHFERLAVLWTSAIVEGLAMTAFFAAVAVWCLVGAGKI